MWFKNIRIYRFTQPFTLKPEQLDQALSKARFIPCNSQDQIRMGWVSPINGQTNNELFVHVSQNYFMICSKRQDKVLPTAVINEFLMEKIEATEETEGRTVGRKERQSLKDQVIMELLPKAFTRSSLQYAYIAPEQGYIIIDAASANKAEEILSSLRQTLGSLPVVPLSSKQIPVQIMTRWVTESTAPGKFTLGDECELADPKESGNVIRCKQQDLTAREINNLLQSGMVVTKLSLNWMAGINFILNEELAIKRVRFEDDIREKSDSIGAQTQAEQFDVDFSVMTIELMALIKDLLDAVGGVNIESRSVEEIVAKVTHSENDRSIVAEVTFA
jgi:recombination associated protein RdgC